VLSCKLYYADKRNLENSFVVARSANNILEVLNGQETLYEEVFCENNEDNEELYKGIIYVVQKDDKRRSHHVNQPKWKGKEKTPRHHWRIYQSDTHQATYESRRYCSALLRHT
jgi:hypothetical protein